MKTTTETNDTLNAARQAIFENLSRPETNPAKSPAGEELDETVVRKPSVRSGLILIVI